VTRVLGVVPALPDDLLLETLRSIQLQTVPVNHVLVLSKRGNGGTFPSRMSEVLNDGLSHVKLADFDYLLRVDGDTFIPLNFLEENLKQNVDVVGYGHAHLIRVAAFLKWMNGKFAAHADDTYLNFKIQSEGGKWAYWNVKPMMTRGAGKRHVSTRYFVERGKVMWQNGYEPLHVLGSPRWDWRNVFAVAGYFAALLARVKRVDCSRFVFWFQIRKLRGDLKRRRRY
jgi:hypothetical protein